MKWPSSTRQPAPLLRALLGNALLATAFLAAPFLAAPFSALAQDSARTTNPPSPSP